MKKALLCALFALALALPAGAQLLSVDGVLIEPRHPTTSDRIRLTASGVASCIDFAPAFYENATGSVVMQVKPPTGGCPAATVPLPFHGTFEIGPLPAGQHLAEVRDMDLPGLTWRELFEVSPDTFHLALGAEDLFDVRIHWLNPRDGSSGNGHARRLARDSGAFWFFSPDNLEVTVKILDGRPVNGHWWVFIASMTDLPFELEISEAGGPARTYVQAAGANRNFIDVNASFEEQPPPPASAAAPLTPEIVLEPESPTPADPVRVEVSVLNTEPDIAFVGMEGHRLVFNYNTYAYPAGEPFPPIQRFTAETTAGPLAPGLYKVDVHEDHSHAFGRTFQVSEPSGQLDLQDTEESYFRVYVNLDLPRGGVGHGVTLSRESGYFWFFDPDNIELTVKILDGRPINGSYWVFIASMTDVPFTVEVERCTSRFDPFGCGSKFYRGVQGVNQNFIDVNYPGQ